MDKLIKKIIKKQNPTVLELDTTYDLIPDYIKKDCIINHACEITEYCNAILTFNKKIISAIADIVPAVKLNCSFYEQLGPQGMKVLNKTMEYAESLELYVIADGKRNDVGSSMEAYANAYIGETKINDFSFRAFPADALTLNPYFGFDEILPATKLCEKFDRDIFVLTKTSDSSYRELQKYPIGNYNYSYVGVIVNETYPEEIKQLRTMLPQTFFVIPEYINIQDIKDAFDNSGLGAIVSSSKAIMCAYKEYPALSFEEACYKEALKIKEDILSVIGTIG